LGFYITVRHTRPQITLHTLLTEIVQITPNRGTMPYYEAVQLSYNDMICGGWLKHIYKKIIWLSVKDWSF